jgi:hypothetical protein
MAAIWCMVQHDGQLSLSGIISPFRLLVRSREMMYDLPSLKYLAG